MARLKRALGEAGMIRHAPPRDADGIAHHPDDTLLLAYASRIAADEAVSLIVATHMSYCAHLPHCKRQEAGQRWAARLLEGPAAGCRWATGALDTVLAPLDQVTPYARPAAGRLRRDGTPDVLRALYRRRSRPCALAPHGAAALSYAPLFRRGNVSRPSAARHPRTPTAAPHSHDGH